MDVKSTEMVIEIEDIDDAARTVAAGAMSIAAMYVRQALVAAQVLEHAATRLGTRRERVSIARLVMTAVMVGE